MMTMWLVGFCMALVAVLVYGSWRVCKNAGKMLDLFNCGDSEIETLLNVFLASLFAMVVCAAWPIALGAVLCWFFGRLCHEVREQARIEPGDTDLAKESDDWSIRQQSIVGDNNVQVAGPLPVTKKRRSKKQPQ